MIRWLCISSFATRQWLKHQTQICWIRLFCNIQWKILHPFEIFFFKDFFWRGPLFYKSLVNLLQYCFCFMFWFFGHEARGILAPRPGIKHAPPTLEGEVLITGPPGKSPIPFKFYYLNTHFWQETLLVSPQFRNRIYRILMTESLLSIWFIDDVLCEK